MRFLTTSSLLALLGATTVIGTPTPHDGDSTHRLEARDKACWIVGSKAQTCVKSPSNWAEVGILKPGSRGGTTFGVSCKKTGKKWKNTSNTVYLYVPWYDCYVSEQLVNSDCEKSLPRC